MLLSDLPALADAIPGFTELANALQQADPPAAEIEGLSGPAKGFVLARLFQLVNRPIVVVTYQLEQAQRLWDDLVRFGVPPEQVRVLPSSRTVFLDDDITDVRAIGERIGALCLLTSPEPAIVIGTAEAFMQRTIGAASLARESFRVAVGESVDLADLATKLVERAYVPAPTVSQPGEFSRRGGIVDIFPSTADSPVRLEFFGDEVQSARTFDVTSQRSTGKVDSVELAPARELRYPADLQPVIQRIRAAYDARRQELINDRDPDARQAIERLHARTGEHIALIEQRAYFHGLEQYLSYFGSAEECALSLVTESTIVVLDEPDHVQDHWDRVTADIASTRDRLFTRGEALDRNSGHCGYRAALRGLGKRPAIALSLLGRAIDDLNITRKLAVNSSAMENYRGRLPALADEAGAWLANDCRVLLVSDQPHRVLEICAELKLPARSMPSKGPLAPGIYVMSGHPRAGFKLADIRLYLLTDAELFGSARPIVRRRVAGGIAISTVLDLRENDFVVHMHHGIGIYRGLVSRKVGENLKDFLLVEYLGGDRLYVPVDQIDRLQRYVGADGAPPQINRIGGQEWQRTTRKVREQAREMAGELIQIYAARQTATRPGLGPDTTWQEEMEEAFPYEETPDQLRAINEVKTDMENERPMDRLICGDVGFGKTEVAIRAAFKVVSSGRQVAVLCPTTILAAQHHATFSERLAAYPVRIDLLSRFRSAREQAQTVRDLADGAVDIVIATHRLLNKDVTFQNLGLLIVDEEQRFGVSHKERLKSFRSVVDVLTLSATPIPRTLSMALSGMRDMSLIEDPPEGRIPVLTFVREYEDNLVRDAIQRELERDGQIYYVHNRVESIFHVAQHIKKLVPDARIEVGHGQMSEIELERVMNAFYHHEFDILVCTTIIENGLDVPNVNTILIDNADHMGLSQLYQLRGRVGRSNRQAYSYLFYRRNKTLTVEAESRLTAMREFSALGSGYKVAMRDLEIRGAGNLLGAEQHGAMVSVGFDLYCKLLSQAVQELRGDTVTEDVLPSVDLPTNAHIPEDYIPGEAERIYFYKRMSSVRSPEDIEALQLELQDRFGDPPRSVWDLLAVLRLRLRAKEAGVGVIKTEGENLVIQLAPHRHLSAKSIKVLAAAFKTHRFTSEGVTMPPLGRNVLRQIEEMIAILEKAAERSAKPAGTPSLPPPIRRTPVGGIR